MNRRFRNVRVRSVLRRLKLSRYGSSSHPTRGWPYIEVHPFGDDVDSLARLGIQASSCTQVDAWCALNGDGTLISCETLRDIQHFHAGPGIYACRKPDRPYWT